MGKGVRKEGKGLQKGETVQKKEINCKRGKGLQTEVKGVQKEEKECKEGKGVRKEGKGVRKERKGLQKKVRKRNKM